MKLTIVMLVLLQLVVCCPSAMAAEVERTETITKTLRFGGSGGERLVIVDNVFGSIEVKGYKGDEVRVTVHKTIEARSEKKAAEAVEEVTLDILEEDDVIEFYVDGQFDSRTTYTSARSVVLGPLQIGNWDGQNRTFDGIIDDVAIWNRALTQGEIAEVMTNGVPAAVEPGGKLTTIWGAIKH